jgi:peptide-methionine (S)-S-oxide reductase
MNYRAHLLLTLVLGTVAGTTLAAEAGRVIPAYVPAAPVAAAATATTETAVVAGGCFWGIQGVYQHVKGVINAVSGYAGGVARTAHYEIVSEGDTGHAESVQVTFDPRQISYAQILQVLMSVGHDPTQLNRQGPDVGTQYRSAIFPANEAQAQIARDYIAQLNKARVYPAAIATRIEPGATFYPAEGYHQDYLFHNPKQAYIAYNDLPKIAELKRIFPGMYRDVPVLVADAAKATQARSN